MRSTKGETRMRVAVMSDIHGFSLALDRVIDDVETQGPFDHVIVAGDLCEGGPAPSEVLQRLQSDAFPCVMGNTDRDIAAGTRRSPRANWTRERIGAKGIDFLAGLPFQIRVKPLTNLADSTDLLVIHANPHDLDRPIQPDAADTEIRELIGEVPASAIAFGHIHIPSIRLIDGRLLVDVSSVGKPKDGDLRSAWGDFTWNDARSSWDAVIRRVPYPIEETIEQILLSGIPRAKKLIKSLLGASY